MLEKTAESCFIRTDNHGLLGFVYEIIGDIYLKKR